MATILIVDDDEKLVAHLSKSLSQAGHTCLVEGNGKSVLKLPNLPEIDLMILDIMIPGLSGFEVCRRIRGSEKAGTLPILFLSAMNSPEEIDHGLAQGADDFLPKPFDTSNLLMRVESLLSSDSHDRGIDETTLLPGSKSIRHEIQGLINSKTQFALAYIELQGIMGFSRLAGAEAREKALRHFARALQICGKALKSGLFAVGHIGSGHFVCMLEPGQAEQFQAKLRKLWCEHLPTLIADVGQEKALAQAQKRASGSASILDFMYCATRYNGPNDTTVHARELFDALSALRTKTLSAKGQAVFIDRRR